MVQTPCQHLLAEGDDVGRLRQVEPLVAPHLPCRPPARLNLVHQENYVVPLADLLQTLEPGWGPVMVSSLGLQEYCLGIIQI